MDNVREVTIHSIQSMIYTVRELQVMLDRDLAELYQVETKVLNQAVKRNIERFPDKFRFQLTKQEFKNLKSQFATSSDNSLSSQNVTLEKSSINLKSQFVTSSSDHGGRRKLN